LVVFVLSACTTFSGVEEPEGPPDEGEEMVFEEPDGDEGADEEGGGEEQTFDFDEGEVDEEEEDFDFEDEEGMEIYLESIPPSGQWLLSEHSGLITCPEGPDTPTPGEAPTVVTIDVSEDGKTVFLPTATGIVALSQSEISTEGDARFSFYEGSTEIEKETLTIKLDYNLEGRGEIFGTIELTIEACTLARPFEAEYIGPAE
jgi:hypothetical protein